MGATAGQVIALLLLALPIHAAITGTVVDTNGAPVVNARVVALDPLLRAPRREQTTIVATASDAKGAFSLDVPGRGVVDVSVRADGFTPADVITAVGDSAGTIVLSKAKTITFNVARTDGAPLPDSTIVVYSVGGGSLVAKTDAAGNARVPDVTQWAEAYDISHDGYETQRFTPEWAGPNFRLNAKPAAATPAATTHIRGIVRDAEKTPLRGVVLVASDRRAFFADASTDANGAYDLAVPPETYEMLQVPGPYVFASPSNIDTTHGDVVRDLVATRLPVFDGKTVREDGTAVSFVRVRADDDTHAQATSSAAGTFRIYARPPAKLIAEKKGLPAASITAEKSPLKIVFRTPAVLSGRIHDVAQKPIANAAVYVDGAIAAITKADGTFTASVAQGAAVVKTGGYPYREVEKKIEVSASTPPLDITLVKQGTVAGRVVDADGKPAAGVHIGVGDKNSWSDGNGDFTFQFIDEGPATIRFGPYLTQTQDVSVPSDNLKLVLTRTRRLRGKVIDAATHAPIPKFVVVHDKTMTPVQSASGEFDVEIARGSSLYVIAPHYVSASDAAVQEQTEDDYTVMMRKGRTVRGRVLDEHGAPIEGVTVTTDEPMQTGKDGRYEAIVTDAEISFEKEGFATKTVQPDGNDDPHTLDVTLHRGIAVTGTVFDKSGAVVPNAEVTASTAAAFGGPWTAVTDASGNFRFADLPSARFDFVAEHGDQLARGSLRDVDVERSGPLKIVLERAETATIFGRVTGIDSPVVVVASSGDRTQQAVTEDGLYRMANAPAGIVQVTAKAQSASASPVTVEVKAGSETQVDLNFAKRVAVHGTVTWNWKQPGVVVRLGGEATATTNNDGAYALSVAPGEYDVTLRYMTAKLPFEKNVVVTGDAEINFELKTSDLHVALVDADTKAAIKGGVAILDRETKYQEMSAATGPDGQIGFPIVPGRPITLRAASDDYASVYEDVAPDANAMITIALTKSGGTVVRIVDARDGSTIFGEIVVRDANGTYAATANKFDSNTGTVTLHLTPGTYQFSSSAEGYGSATITANVPPENEVRIPLLRGGSLLLRAASDIKATARLILPNGQPYVRCWCNGIADIPINDRTTLVDRIAPGNYTLEVTPRGGKARHFPVTVAEGQTVAVSIE